MRLAIIDLGTNSVRFDVHQLGPGRKLKLLHREKMMVRLGQGVFLQGHLNAEAIRRTLEAFVKFKELALKLRVDKIRAFATSAMREVSDRDKFVSLVRRRTGIDLRVISGLEEAKLIALGVLANEDLGAGRFALVDIGGGSTEVSICRGRKILHSASLPLGTARLQQVFLKKSPPSPESVEELKAHVRNLLHGEIVAGQWPKVSQIIGSSGTIKALERLLRALDQKFEFENVTTLTARMAEMTTTELLGISGMESKRVDMILAGAILFQECMSILDARRACATEFSLRDGILEEELLAFQAGEASPLSVHTDDLIAKAVTFGGDAAHLKRTASLAEQVFRVFKPLHRLRHDWHAYLVAAAVLRDVGEYIAPAKHAMHSGYIVRNTDMPPMDGWELELITKLIQFHEADRVGNKDLPFKKQSQKSQERNRAFLRLLALLKIVDALDSGPGAHLKVRRARTRGKNVEIEYSGRGLSGMESLNVGIQSDLFERVFKKTLSGRSVR